MTVHTRNTVTTLVLCCYSVVLVSSWLPRLLLLPLLCEAPP
jgi:hypothetical protein